ncbi:hypothetical protein F5Y16DRAFT_558 [Xylariaceae sp. FL0255]|nr:hypothetical protein F5Y16DRAFT_558 [Xylariaceae sp. FL0255]
MHFTTAAALLLAGSNTVSAACSITDGVKTTFYGSPDNSPPGDGTAYDCLGRGYVAGGTGTYADPLTFAAVDGGTYAECEVVYSPYLKKYLVLQDTCSACSGPWTDIWTGTAADGGNAQLKCEDDLTPNAEQSIIRSPATNLAVDTTALWTGSTCNTGHVYPSNTPSDYCSSGGGGGSSGCQTGCSWAGHCIGCACETYNDCSDDYVCTNGLCANP